MKSLLILLALGVAAMAQPVITPSTPPVVAQGTTLKFTANVRVQWSLGPGSAGTIDADGTYHAPSHVDVNQKAGGCQALPDDHIYNTRIDTLPVLTSSAAWMASIPSTRLSFPASWGLNVMDSSTPSQPMHFYYSPQNDGMYQVPAWPNLKQQSGVFYDPLTAGDRHIVAVNHDTCQFDEFYNAYPLGTNVACPTCTGQGGVKFQGNSYALNGGTDAAGMYLEPLTPRLEEFYAGAIKHALRFTLKNNYLARAFVWPARANASPWGHIPYGSRFRLKKSHNIATFSPTARIVLTALQQYGMFVADGGFNFDVEVGTDVTLDAGVMAAFAEIQKSTLRSTDFEIVDESALMVNSASGQVNDQNPYVTPAGFATVIATDPTNTAHPARVRVTLEGIVVDAPEPAVWIQSGVSKQLTAWVSGTTNPGVTWSMNPALGVLTADGYFTASAVTVPSTARVTAASIADPAATTTLSLTVLPAGPIRIDSGSSADYGPDSHGNMWWRDQASESSWGVSHNNGYLGQNPWPQTVPDIALYYTDRYSLGDIVYQFSVPNGNYKLKAMLAVPGIGPFPAGAYLGHLEAQGQIVYRDFDLASVTGGQRSQPGSVDLPAQVTDGTLYFAVRRLTTPTTTPYPLLLNGLEIVADSSAPSLSVFSPAKGALSTGQTRQFYAVGWYIPNTVIWSVSPAIGSIDANGRYTAPSTPQLSDQQVTVKAVSTVDSSKTASATFTLTYGTITVAPSQATINRSATQQFTASLGGIADANVQWSITPQVGAIDAKGLYTAPDALATDTAIKVTATSTDNSGKRATAVVTVLAKVPAIRINCGETLYPITDSSGNVWAADHGWTNLSSSAPSSHLGDCCAVFHNVVPADQPIYRSATYTDPYASPLADFYYSFPVPNGLYRVTLKLGSYNAHGTLGQYVMNVVANGTTVLSNFDVVKAAGGNLIAVDQSFDVSVTGKVLRLDFLHVGKGVALVNGIQIVAK